MMLKKKLGMAAQELLPPLIYRTLQRAWSPARTTPGTMLPNETNAVPAKPPEPKPLDGYEFTPLVELVFAKTTALLGRDLSDMPGAERTLFAVSLSAARVSNRPLCVLDFGGACGYHYHVAEPLGFPLKWAVAESKAMANRAKVLETENLRFFDTIPEARDWLGQVDLMYSSSTLQYVPQPLPTLEELIGIGAPVIVWSRMALSKGATTKEIQTSLLSENGPGPLPSGFEDALVSYPITRLSRTDFIAAHRNYTLLTENQTPSEGYVFVRAA